MLILTIAVVVGWMWLRPWADEPRAALTTFCRATAREEAFYPQRGATLRSRTWLTSSPSRPNGVDLFIAMPDVSLSRERSITPADLRETVRRIRGLAWDPATSAWTDGSRMVPLSDVRSLLVAALPTATDADAVIDLLAGKPAPGIPDLHALLTAEPQRLARLRMVSFSGDCGRLLLDRGKASYVLVDRGYTGLLLSIDAEGVDKSWRILWLKAAQP